MTPTDAPARTRRRALDRRILALAIPAAGSAMLHIVHSAVDMYWIGRLGTEPLASISVSRVTVWMFGSLGALIGTGLTALVARYAGAGRPEAARYVGSRGLQWACVLGLVAGAVGFALTPLVFVAADTTQGVARAGAAYTRIFWAGGALVLLQQAGDAVFRGHGNTRVPFLAAATALVVNVVLDPILIHGAGPIPALGVPGAAWATLIATAVGFGLVFFALLRRGYLGRTRPSDEVLRLAADTRLGHPAWFGLDTSVLRRTARVGAPVAVSGLFFTSIYLVIHRIAAQADGAAAQAGLGIGHTAEGVAYVICLGWGAAAAALVGRHLGAGEPDDAARAAWRAVQQCALICLVWGAVLLLFADGIAGALASHGGEGAGARMHATTYLRIVAICLAPQAVEVVLEGAFGGAGLTVPPMIVSAVFSLLRIPLSILAAFHWGMGAAGIWWTIAVTAILRGLVVGLWFARDTWKTRTV